jgi:riboflavin-specific deaminase-like protein
MKTIDESTAWHLLRAVPPGCTVKNPSAYIYHHSSPDVWLQVQTGGVWEASAPVTDEARVLLDLFLPLQLQTEFVIAQTGQSLDGRIATESGHSHYVTGAADIRRLHRLRAIVDAVVVGAGTVAADDPHLTVRAVDGNNPVRVVLDPKNRLDRNKHVFSDGAARTLVVHQTSDQAGRAASPQNGDTLLLPIIDTRATNNPDGFASFDPKMILEALNGRGYKRILIEGGGITISRFLQADVLDRLHVTVAPLLIGSGRPALSLTPITSLQQALRPTCRHFHLGEDVLFDLDLRQPSDLQEEPVNLNAPRPD